MIFFSPDHMLKAFESPYKGTIGERGLGDSCPWTRKCHGPFGQDGLGK